MNCIFLEIKCKYVYDRVSVSYHFAIKKYFKLPEIFQQYFYVTSVEQFNFLKFYKFIDPRFVWKTAWVTASYHLNTIYISLTACSKFGWHTQ